VSPGVVDKIRIYNRPLTAAEVGIVFAGGTLGGTAGGGSPADLLLKGAASWSWPAITRTAASPTSNQGTLTIESDTALGATTGGTVVADGTQLQIVGNVTVAGEALTIQGTGVGQRASTVPLRWFAAGPAPVLNGQTAGNLNVSGRVTGVVIDPSDPNVMYISTAGGGAWKTRNSGQSWSPLFDGSRRCSALPSPDGDVFAAVRHRPEHAQQHDGPISVNARSSSSRPR